MKYYLHDTSAFDDEKISELFINFGYEGLGLFYTTLEKIGKQEKPIKTDILKSQLRVGKRLEKCWSFMEEIGLISSSNGESFNNQILNFSETYQIKKEKTREKVSEWRKKQADIKNVTSYVPVSNLPKVKESKVNEGKEDKKEAAISSAAARQKVFYNSLVPFLQEHPKERIKQFYEYWSELNKSQTKMRFEMEKTWEIPKRLTTWKNKENDFKKPFEKSVPKPKINTPSEWMD